MVFILLHTKKVMYNLCMEEATQKQNKRQSNFELLRIICMLFIIAHHLSWHSNIPNNISNFNLYFHRSLIILGKIAVNLFVLISGYFMINSKFSFKKVLKLILETTFYSLIIYSLLCIFGLKTFNIKMFIDQVLSIYSQQYWFMSYFIILYILSPFLNKVLKQCSIKEFVVLLSVLLIFQLDIFGIKSNVSLSLLAWFITLYITAAFLRLHFDDKGKVGYAWLAFFISLTIIVISTIVFEKNYCGENNILSFIFSIATFYIFKYIEIKHSKIINLIASTTLGVYLIHDNNIINKLIWNKWLNIPYHITTDYYWLFCICVILLVFTISCLIDLIRILIDKLCTQLIKQKKAK